MNDGLAAFIAAIFYIWAFCMWAYGVAVCWRADELFWAVISVVVAPVGFIVGVYNWIF